MCGIAGIVFTDAGRPVDASLLRAMGDALAHRGPDAEGYWIRSGIGLAHRRLSIIDVQGGQQPMANEDGSIQIVFNGEIYNYRALRRELEGRGHRFRTRSDTEVVVHLYEELGERLVERLRGMFAFALWDNNRQRMVLARDRVGLKPLYFYRDAEQLLFASEMKAILEAPDVPRNISPQALEDYLTFGMVPGPRTIFSDIYKLPPAHLLVIDKDNWTASPRRYWQLHNETRQDLTVDQWLELLQIKFDETVAAHQVADVPVGAFLSGGVDSSAIVAALSDYGTQRIKTFSVGFQGDRDTELPYALQVAQQYTTDHHEEILAPSDVPSLEDLVDHFDEPFADSSALPTMAICRVAREHVKVVLSGDGGDEAFGGYARYAHDVREARVRRTLPRWLRRTLLFQAARLWPQADWLPRRLRAKTTLTNLSLDAADAYANTLSICRTQLRQHLLNSDVRCQINGYRPEDQLKTVYGINGDALRAMTSADIALLLPDDFLTKVDRASMAVGLEVRPPLVDHELLELAMQIPSSLKIRSGQSKWIFKQLCRNHLPSDILWRPKRGFEMPLDRWLRGPLREAFEDRALAPGSPLHAYINAPRVRQLYNAHLRGTGQHGQVLWSLLVLAAWMEKYGTSSSRKTPYETPPRNLHAL